MENEKLTISQYNLKEDFNQSLNNSLLLKDIYNSKLLLDLIEPLEILEHK